MFVGSHPKLGGPVSVYRYKDADGLLFWVCRYVTAADPSIGQEAGSTYKSWVYSSEVGGAKIRIPPAPRPLYHLDELQARPNEPVYLVSNERSAEALKKAGNGHSLVATAAFAGDFKSVRWTDLAGRTVILWPDNDDASIDGMRAAVSALLPLKCVVRIVSVPRETKPEHWNVADAVQQGWAWQQVADFIADHEVIAKDLTAKVVQLRKPKVTVEKAEKPAPPEPAKAGWRQWDLDCKANGLPWENTENVCRILAHIAKLGGSFGNLWYDEFAQRIYTDTLVGPRAWEEADTISLQCFLQANVEMKKVGKSLVYDAVVRMARRRTTNCVREWLESLQWDGIERLAHMLSDGWGVAQDEYIAAVGRCFLMGAVKRILEPGCKLDYMVVFEGAEGINKTSALQTLFGLDWHVEPKYSIRESNFVYCLANKWVIEFSEMAQLEGVSHKLARSFLTTVSDYYRAAYERNASDHKRMCVFAATVNGDDWHDDPHGARRFWPVACSAIDLDWIRCYRDQLFAEAYVRVQRQECYWDVPAEAARTQQDERRNWDTWQSSIGLYVAGKRFVRVESILLDVCGLEMKDWDKRAQQRVADTLRSMRWTRTRQWQAEGRAKELVRGWRPPTDYGTLSTPER